MHVWFSLTNEMAQQPTEGDEDSNGAQPAQLNILELVSPPADSPAPMLWICMSWSAGMCKGLSSARQAYQPYQPRASSTGARRPGSRAFLLKWTHLFRHRLPRRMLRHHPRCWRGCASEVRMDPLFAVSSRVYVVTSTVWPVHSARHPRCMSYVETYKAMPAVHANQQHTV